MYLLQVIINIHFGSTGMVDRRIEHYEAETLKPLIIKANRILNEHTDNCFLNFHFYQLSRDYCTEIKNGTFNFEKLETLTDLLYFGCSGNKVEVEDGV